MSRFSIILNAQLTLIVYMALGWLIQRAKLVTDHAAEDLMSLVQWVTLPCLIIESLGREITLEQIFQSKDILLVSAGIMVISHLCGCIAFRNEQDLKRRAVLKLGVLSSNCGGSGLSLLQSTMGAEGVLYANLYAIPSRIASWSVGVSYFIDLPWKKRLQKALLNPSLIAIAVGILLQFWCPELMPGIWDGISKVGKCNNPISMFTVGMVLAQAPKSKTIDVGIIKLALLRLIVIPLTAFGACRLMQTSREVLVSAVLLCGSPSAVISNIIAEQYGGDHELASKCIFITTVCSVFTAVLFFVIS